MQLYKDEIDKELILNAEIQRQNLKALPKVFKDRKIKNPTTQKMIDEFKQQFNKKTGDKAYLFPEYTPLLIDQNDELSKLQQPFSIAQIIDANNDIDIFTKRYKLLNDIMIPQHRRIIEENKDEINKINDELSSVKSRVRSKMKKKQIKLQDEIKDLEDYIIRDTNDTQDLLSDINQIKKIIEENNEISDNYANVKFSIEQKNKKILSDYENNVRILNEGKIITTQKPDETEQEYLERLSNMVDEEYDDTELIERAYLSNINNFKENMKKVLSSEWKIETIMKSLDREEVFLLNKIFPAFEKQIIKTFGKNNSNVSVEDYIELIKLHIYGEDKEKLDKLDKKIENIDDNIDDNIEDGYSIFSKFDNIINNFIVYDLIEDGMILQITNEENNKSIFLLLDDKNNDSINRVIYRYERYGNDNLFKRQNKNETFIINFIKIFREYLEMSDEQISELFNIKNNFNELQFSKILNTKFGLSELKFEGLGIGIKQLKQEIPKIFEFGKVILLLDKLYYKNTLSIKDKKKQNIQGLPNTKVSNEFVSLIMKMIKEETPSFKDDIYELSENEQELFTILLYKSGFYKEIPTNNKIIINKLKDRLKLVEGTIKAGNNNTDNFKELYDIIFKMTNLGVITLSAGRTYYKEIKKEYS